MDTTILSAVSVNDPPRNFPGADVRVPVLILSIYAPFADLGRADAP